MEHAHARTLNERPIIVLNSFGQPVGPTEEIAREFKLFLGTLAKDPEYAPLTFTSWPKALKYKEEKIWNYVQVCMVMYYFFYFIVTILPSTKHIILNVAKVYSSRRRKGLGAR